MKKILYIFIVIFLLGCSTIKEIPVETIKIEKSYNNSIDSIIIRDSIDRIIRGDSILIYTEHIEYRYRDKVDTILKVDSIPKIVQVEVEKITNKTYWWQKLLMWLGGALTIAFIAFILYKLKK